ncbi:MAG: hypothetical protein GX934_16255 [Burkholderiales bacterium]|nr:hypothetical protein [Burkholderiales bacterium]
MRTEAIEVGLDARKACIEERSVVGNYVSTAEVRLTTQTGPPRWPNATVGGGFRGGAHLAPPWVSGFPFRVSASLDCMYQYD